MLNELHEIDRALGKAGIVIGERHPDIKEVSARDGLLWIRLREHGEIDEVQFLDAERASRLWNIRDGNHNSFPYHKLKSPLLKFDSADERLGVVRSKRHSEPTRWDALQGILNDSCFNEDGFTTWPEGGWLRRLRERRGQLAPLVEGDAAAVPAVFDRFLRSCENPSALLHGLLDALTGNVRNGRAPGNLPLVAAALLEGQAPLYFDVSEYDFDRDAGDPTNVEAISEALDTSDLSDRSGMVAPGSLCAVTGRNEPLVNDKFPQPNLPILGQTYLFAKNRDAPTSARYGRVGTDGIPVGREAAVRFQGAIETLTRDDWKGRTWRGIPGERPKQTDLFLAFVPADPTIPVAGPLADDVEADPEAPGRFASLAQRLTEAFEGRVLPRREEEPLSMVVLRKLDPANRKVVYSDTVTVGRLLRAAALWSEGCRNTPPGIRLPVPTGSGAPALLQPPREIAPLSLIGFTRQQFIRAGTERQDVVGANAVETMRLFFASGEAARLPARSLLHRVLRQRGVLVEGTAQAQRKGFDALKDFDRRATLDTVTVLGLLLHKLGRPREEYMQDNAFRLGQLLAAADILHAGYNASERGGSRLPPRLIGNNALQMAQGNPVRALAVLARRWAVYHGWAQRNAHYEFPKQFEGKKRTELKNDDERRSFDRARDIRRGISVAWRAAEAARELGKDDQLPQGDVSDSFRAELLLGYIAGPFSDRDEAKQEEPTTNNLQEGE